MPRGERHKIEKFMEEVEKREAKEYRRVGYFHAYHLAIDAGEKRLENKAWKKFAENC